MVHRALRGRNIGCASSYLAKQVTGNETAGLPEPEPESWLESLACVAPSSLCLRHRVDSESTIAAPGS